MSGIEDFRTVHRSQQWEGQVGSLQSPLDKRLFLKKEEREQKGQRGNPLYQEQNTQCGTDILSSVCKVLAAKVIIKN